MDELQLIIHWRCLQRERGRECEGDVVAENWTYGTGASGNLRCSSWSPRSDYCVPASKKNEEQLAETCLGMREAFGSVTYCLQVVFPAHHARSWPHEEPTAGSRAQQRAHLPPVSSVLFETALTSHPSCGFPPCE